MTGRWPPTAVFLLNGLVLATYVVRLPSLRIEHGLGAGGLGLIGAAFALAALAAMQFTGRLAARAGTHRLLQCLLVLLPLLLALVGRSGPRPLFVLSVVLLGAAHGVMDAAMNAYAVDIEQASGRPVLSGCHAAWSISAILASATAVPLVGAGVGTPAHFPVAAAVLLAGGLAAAPFVRPVPRRETAPPDAVRWSRTLVLLGLSGTALMVVDGAALAWGAIFLDDVRGVPLALATAAVTAYTAGAAGGRLVGDWLVLRLGARRLFRGAGLIGVAGLAAAVTAPWPAVAVTGLGVLGAGSSLLLPLTFSAVGDVAAGAAAMARFTTFTYAGILLGPALIGGSAELVGLTATFAALLPVLAAVVLLSRAPDLVDARAAGRSAPPGVPSTGTGGGRHGRGGKDPDPAGAVDRTAGGAAAPGPAGA